MTVCQGEGEDCLSPISRLVNGNIIHSGSEECLSSNHSKIKSWIKMIWLVWKDLVILCRGEHDSAADLELLPCGKPLALRAYNTPNRRLVYTFIVLVE